MLKGTPFFSTMEEVGYGFYVDENLNAQTILQQYSQEEIIKIVFGEYPNYGKMYSSPFRNDDHPGCVFEHRENGMIYFVDWADNPVNRDCFQIIMDKFNIEFVDALRYITYYFTNHDLVIEVEPNQNIINEYQRKPKPKFPILYKVRNFGKIDTIEWGKCGISIEDLMEDGVKAISAYKFFSFKRQCYMYIMCNNSPQSYVYTEFISGHVKIYRPHIKDAGKWTTNCSQNDIGNYINLPLTGKQLIITKSYKDCRVLRNLGYTAIWFQNEGMFPDDWFFKDIIPRFSDIVILFDNDNAGIKNAKKLVEIFKKFKKRVRMIYSPYSNAKDPAEIYEIHGINNLKQFLNETIRCGTSNMEG